MKIRHYLTACICWGFLVLAGSTIQPAHADIAAGMEQNDDILSLFTGISVGEEVVFSGSVAGTKAVGQKRCTKYGSTGMFCSSMGQAQINNACNNKQCYTCKVIENNKWVTKAGACPSNPGCKC